MKNLKPMLLTLIAATTVFSTSSQAFDLQKLEDVNVADANFCNDYNHLVTYDLGLSKAEALPETELSLLTSPNLDLLAVELRAHFTVPRSGRTLRILSMGAEAGQAFAGSDLKQLETQEYCFGKNFRDLFGFEMKGNRFTPKNPGQVTYLRVAFELPLRMSEPATVIINRSTGKLYIHQEW